MAAEKENDLGTKLTRGRFLKATGAGLAWITLANALGCNPVRPIQQASGSSAQPQQVWSFHSRPDLSPPTVEVLTQAHQQTAPGYIFLAPKKGAGQDGPMIVDNSGQLVWFRPLQSEEKDTMDFRVQRYRGEPVLTWWEGVHTGYGNGEYVIMDSSYREIKRFKAANGYQGDHHEFLITAQNTALITIYNPVPKDLSALGGSKDGEVLDGIAQEIDLQTGRVLFEWHSLDHVDLDESYYRPPKKAKWPFDYFHINSIDVDHDNNLLISARRTSTVYKVERRSGEVIWRLGGKKSSFKMGEGLRRAFQHDARRQADGTLTIFDNGDVRVDKLSRALVLELNERAMTATLVREYPNPRGKVADTQGDVQVLPNKNVFVGWGSEPFFSEFSREGELLFDGRFSDTSNESYRAFRFPWSAQPGEEDLVVAAERPKKDGAAEEKLTLYVSWNGATEVASWQVLAGSSPERLKPVGSFPKDGFETTIMLGAPTEKNSYVSVQAEDRWGRVLATSKPGS